VIIADTNLIGYLFIDGERTFAAEQVWELDPQWLMPPLWRSEFLNVLTTGVKAMVLTEQQAVVLWWKACELFPRNDQEPRGDEVLRTAIERGISAYDAHFIALAVDLGIPLVTADKDLVRRCSDVAVSIEQFVRSDP